MNFGSTHVNACENNENNVMELSETEMEGDLERAFDSDEEEESSSPRAAAPPARGSGFFGRFFSRAPAPAHSSNSRPPPHPRKQKDAKKHKPHVQQRVDTNVVCVAMNELAKNADQLATGDPNVCENPDCKAIFSPISTCSESAEEKMDTTDEAIAEEPITLEEGEQLWKCEFCGHRNVLELEPEERPQGSSQDYILKGAKQGVQSGNAADEDRSIIFCVDVSGSMCVTQEVRGKFKLKGNKRKSEFDGLDDEGVDQMLAVGGRRNVTWVSRLQCVQAAVDAQIESLSQDHPGYKIGLVTFSNDVTIHGDASKPVEIITGDKLHNQELLQEIGTKYTVEQPLSASQKSITEKLWGLTEGGATALGPSLVVSVAMAARQKGSKVILCTDGLANTGLGSLEGHTTEEELSKAEQWYESIGTWAAMSGVTVDVISITDAQCSLENLGKVTDATQGHVNKVNPLELHKNFQGILENPVIATHVSATMLVHKFMYFTDEESVEVLQGQSEGSKVRKEVGNVTDDTEVFFDFALRRDCAPRIEKEKITEVPFQVQIAYSRLDGSECVRVISARKPITFKDDLAEKNVDLALMAANVTQRTARLAHKGDYEKSRKVQWAQAKYMKKVSKKIGKKKTFKAYTSNVSGFDQMLQQEQQSEVMDGVSDMVSSQSAQQKQVRSRRRNDNVSKAMFSMKQTSSSAYH